MHGKNPTHSTQVAVIYSGIEMRKLEHWLHSDWMIDNAHQFIATESKQTERLMENVVMRELSNLSTNLAALWRLLYTKQGHPPFTLEAPNKNETSRKEKHAPWSPS
jgi:hypothetical protein